MPPAASQEHSIPLTQPHKDRHQSITHNCNMNKKARRRMIGIKHITIPTALGIKQDQTYRPDFSIISQTVDIRLVSALIGSPNA